MQDQNANTTSAKTVTASRCATLQSKIKGSVILPDAPQYDKARQAWNLTVNQRPAVIVVAEGPSDIVEAVKFAMRENLNISVQSTGHGVVRPATGNLLIITSRMKEIRVNVDSQTTWVEAGVKWGEALEKTQAVGLAPLLGSSPDVGVVGYTLGGGFGWLGRKYGLSTDSVNFFELVTGDGRLLRASEGENNDLFWGLRGGGGGFGIITGMEIKLYPVSTVYGGNLLYPIQSVKEIYARYRDWIGSAPDELTSSIVLMNFPQIPMIPEFLRGQSFVMVRGCYCGPVEKGEALLKPWRDWRSPSIDEFKVMPFSQVAAISNDPVDPIPALSTGAWLRELSDDVIDVLARFGLPGNDPCPLIFTEIRHAGGAVARGDPQAGAYGNRDSALLLQMVGMTPTPDSHGFLVEYTNQVKNRLQPFMTGGVYMNFLESEESQRRVKDGYLPEAYQRLLRLKSTYDPHNRLHSGFKL